MKNIKWRNKKVNIKLFSSFIYFGFFIVVFFHCSFFVAIYWLVKLFHLEKKNGKLFNSSFSLGIYQSTNVSLCSYLSQVIHIYLVIYLTSV